MGTMELAGGGRGMLPIGSFTKVMHVSLAALALAAPVIIWPHAHDAVVLADAGGAARDFVPADPVSRVTEWALQQGLPTVLLLAVMILIVQSIPKLLTQVQGGYENLAKVQKEKLQLMQESFKSVQDQQDRQLRIVVDELREQAGRYKESVDLMHGIVQTLKERASARE